jgi:hypothetical protein
MTNETKLHSLPPSRSALRWHWELLEQQEALLGEDPASYSIETTRYTLETFSVIRSSRS